MSTTNKLTHSMSNFKQGINKQIVNKTYQLNILIICMSQAETRKFKDFTKG